MERRAFIRTALTAGGGAWIAPSILTIDAAAAQGSGGVTTGLNRWMYDPFTGTFLEPTNGGGCNPNDWNGVPAASSAVLDVSITGTVGNRTFTFTLLAPNCTFTEAIGKCGSTGNVCFEDLTAVGGTVATFQEGAGVNECPDPEGFVQIKLVVLCA